MYNFYNVICTGPLSFRRRIKEIAFIFDRAIAWTGTKKRTLSFVRPLVTGPMHPARIVVGGIHIARSLSESEPSQVHVPAVVPVKLDALKTCFPSRVKRPHNAGATKLPRTLYTVSGPHTSVQVQETTRHVQI